MASTSELQKVRAKIEELEEKEKILNAQIAAADRSARPALHQELILQLSRLDTLQKKEERLAAQLSSASTPSTALTAGAAAATATSLREEPAGAQLLSRLLAPLDELDVLQFKVFNTPRRFRSTLKVNMQQFGVRGRIRRETTTCVSVTAVVATDEQAQQDLAEFVRAVINIAPIRDVGIEDRSRPYTRPQPIERKSVRGSDNADILTMYEEGVQVDKVSQAVKRGYKDVSEISSDPSEAQTTRSSVAGASRSNLGF